MSTFRMVHTEFWNDPTVIEEMTPEDKYFFLYLLTNPNTTQVGIYQITKKQIGFDMGYSMETVNSLLDRFLNHHVIIKYNEKTREIAIKNWGKYNLKRGGKPMLDCVKSELENVKCLELISYVGANVQNEPIKKIYDSYNVTSHDTDNDTLYDTSKKEESNSIKGSDDTSTSRTTYRGQYKEQEQDKEEDKDKEQQQEQEELKEPEVAKITQFWDKNGFGENNINAKQSLLLWLDDSPFQNPSKMIIKALEIACSNNKRRLNYVEGILRNWQNESLLTIEEVENNDERIHGHRNGYAGSNGKGTSYEQALRESELARRTFNRC